MIAETSQPGVASNRHYDSTPRVFELFLDPTLKYSSGLYAHEGVSLAEAQQHKLTFIVDNLELRPDSVLLDVGCGWGSLTCHAAQRVGCSVIGITPAATQADYVRRRAAALGIADRVSVTVSSLEALELKPRSLDAVSLVGSIVHVENKRDALAKLYAACRPGATVYLSETCFRNEALQARYDARPGTGFIRQEIFGQGELIPLSRYVAFLEDAGFSLTGLRDLSADYRKTIEHWRENARANAAPLEALEPGIVERLERYFDIANAAWGYTSKHYAVTAKRAR